MIILGIVDRVKSCWLLKLPLQKSYNSMTQSTQTIFNLKAQSTQTNPLLFHERKLWREGLFYVAGVDEAGRGPLAGPVYAAAVIFPQKIQIKGIDDSKRLSSSRREALFDIIIEKAISVGIGWAEHYEIDEMNILQATYLAMNRALGDLSVRPQHVLVDGRGLPENSFAKTAIIGGDRRCFSIAAASIIAKVSRDRVMHEYHKQYPQYGFEKHKGYPTQMHIDAIKKYGFCPIHRRSFHIRQLDHAK